MNPQKMLESELKSMVNLVQLISTRVPLNPAGRFFRGTCCFCAQEDHDHSLYVSPRLRQWRCFGQCASGGDAVAFLMQAEKITHGQAVRRLAVESGLAPPKEVLETETETLGTYPALLSTMADTMEPDFTSGTCGREARAAKLVREQRSGRKLRLCSDGLWRPDYYYDDRQLTVGNLCYTGSISGKINRSGTKYFRALDPELRPVGIVVALPSTLEDHCDIEVPDGRIRTEDAAGIFNAGEITWVSGEAILKDVILGDHRTATLLGMSSMGFCLIAPEGSPPFWIAPKEPDAAGGSPRPFAAYIHGVEGRSVHLVSLESFFIQDSIEGAVPGSYTDVSGVEVPINVPKWSPKRHADRIDRNRCSETGDE
jgi:hypothetical protein